MNDLYPMRAQFQHRVAMQARGILCLRVGAAVLTWLFYLALARALDPAEFGVVGLALNLAILVSVVGAFGQHFQVVRTLPGLGRKATMECLKRSGSLTMKGTSLALLALGLLSTLPFMAATGLSEPRTLVAVILISIAVATADFLAHVARGLGAAFLALWPKDLAWRVASLGLLASLAIAGGVQYLPVLLGSALILMFLVALQGLLIHRKIASLPIGQVQAPQSQNPRDFWLTSLTGHFLANADTIIVAAILGPLVAGPYFVASRLAVFLGFFLNAENMAIAPEIARNSNRGDLGKLQTLIEQSARRVSGPTIFGAAGLILMSNLILSAFGDGYQSAQAALIWLCLGAVMNAVSGPADLALIMAGHEKTARQIAIVILVISAAMMIGAAAVSGGTGVAAAVCLATVLRKLACWHAVLRRLGFRTDAFVQITWDWRSKWQS